MPALTLGAIGPANERLGLYRVLELGFVQPRMNIVRKQSAASALTNLGQHPVCPSKSVMLHTLFRPASRAGPASGCSKT